MGNGEWGMGRFPPPFSWEWASGNGEWWEWGMVGMGRPIADSMKSGWGGRGRTASPIPHSRLPIPASLFSYFSSRTLMFLSESAPS